MDIGRPAGKSYAALVHLLGEDTANLLCRIFGSQRLYIPVLLDDPSRRKVQEGAARTYHRLVNVIGEEKTRLLCLAYCGDYFVVPMNTSTDARELHQLMAKMHKEGAKVNEIAAAVGVSRRTIFRWLNKHHSSVTAA